MLPQLPLQSRERHERRARGDEAFVWGRGTRHHDHGQCSCSRISSATVISRPYAQLKGIAGDVDDARVYGGIHWRFDQVAGNALGRAVATEVAKNNLRPVHP